MTTILRLKTPRLKADITTRLVISLKAENILCLPSDTCYGLSCLATSQRATEKLRQLKNRDKSKPFILITYNVKMAKRYIKNWTPEAEIIKDAFWPGPITIVMPFHQYEPSPITHTSKTIAVRVPGSTLLKEIIHKAGCPLWSTSANAPNTPCASTIQEIPTHLRRHIDLILDVGKLVGDEPSTIIDLSKKVPIILREGPIKAEDIISKTNIQLLNDDVDR